jgi:hypothetical protein
MGKKSCPLGFLAPNNTTNNACRTRWAHRGAHLCQHGGQRRGVRRLLRGEHVNDVARRDLDCRVAAVLRLDPRELRGPVVPPGHGAGSLARAVELHMGLGKDEEKCWEGSREEGNWGRWRPIERREFEEEKAAAQGFKLLACSLSLKALGSPQ